MKGIDSTGAPLVHDPGWVGGWMGGWVEVKAVLRIAYSNKKLRSYETGKSKIVNQGKFLLFELLNSSH
jgi:hypothetical protein